MASERLDNLVKTGVLKVEPSVQAELDGMIHSGSVRIKDAENTAPSIESRFDLAYNAAHSFALAALRAKGYRSENRYVVFQLLEETLEIPAAQWRVRDKAHNQRNRAEYEGDVIIDATWSTL